MQWRRRGVKGPDPNDSAKNWIYSQFSPLPIRPSKQLAPGKYGAELVSSVTTDIVIASLRFSLVSVGRVRVGCPHHRPTWSELVGRLDIGGEVMVTKSWDQKEKKILALKPVLDRY